MHSTATSEMMRGRAITGEEFDRMVESVGKVRMQNPDAWKNFIKGLWNSRLRLSESLELSWDETEPFCICTDGKFPEYRIYAESQTRKKDQLFTMAPEFWEMVQATPAADRSGPVLPRQNSDGEQISAKRVSRTFAGFGKMAGIVTNADRGEFVSSHDLRWSFGLRWAKRMKPLVLKKMMRHTKLETTLRYYADLDADKTSQEIWESVKESDQKPVKT